MSQHRRPETSYKCEKMEIISETCPVLSRQRPCASSRADRRTENTSTNNPGVVRPIVSLKDKTSTDPRIIPHGVEEGRDIHLSDTLHRRFIEMRSSIASKYGHKTLFESSIRKQRDIENTSAGSRRTHPDPNFGASSRGWVNHEDDFDTELWRLNELRLLACPGSYISRQREMILADARQSEEQELRRWRFLKELERLEMLHQSFHSSENKARNRERQILDLQSRSSLLDAPLSVSRDMTFPTRDKITTFAAGGLGNQPSWTGVSSRSGALDDRFLSSSDISSQLPDSRLLLHPRSADDGSYSTLEALRAQRHSLQRSVEEELFLSRKGTTGAMRLYDVHTYSSDSRKRRRLSPWLENPITGSMGERVSQLKTKSSNPRKLEQQDDCKTRHETECDPDRRAVRENALGSKNGSDDVDDAPSPPKGLSVPLEGSQSSIARLIERYSAGGRKQAPFPLKLHAILANPAYHEIIGWLPHGKSWKIFQTSLFEKVLVPRHFRHAKYASFMRQGKDWRVVILVEITSSFVANFIFAPPPPSLSSMFASKWLGFSTKISLRSRRT